MKIARFVAGVLIGCVSAVATAALPVGTLVRDGPATPEQIALYLPVTGALASDAAAQCRFKLSNLSNWSICHPLHRVSEASAPDAFAWTILDVSPGSTYDVEVTVASAGQTSVQTLNTTTRTLPPASGATTVSISAGSTAAHIATVFDTAPAGAVVELAVGTYNGPIALSSGGTSGSSKTLRGASRSGTILRNLSNGSVLAINGSNITVEGLTIQGTGTDSGTASSSVGIRVQNTQSRLTIRNVTMTGVDRGYFADQDTSELLIYNNTITGNNTWTQAKLESNAYWNDDGIVVSGQGNAAFQNTVRGFGDTFTVSPLSNPNDANNIHVYRNDVTMGGDDCFEMDEGVRNITFYDNRARNVMTLVSFDDIYGGPVLIARNQLVNSGREPFKMKGTNTINSGMFIYNNTIVRTNGAGGGDDKGWYYLFDETYYAYVNNLLVWRGTGTTFVLAADDHIHNPIDWHHNSWYPDGSFRWDQLSWASLALTQAALNSQPATTPIFDGITRRMQNDAITNSNPFVATVTLGANYLWEVTTAFNLALPPSEGAARPGYVIPNITDGFSNATPDRGAVIAGRSVPTWGDQSSGPGATGPMPPTQLQVQ